MKILKLDKRFGVRRLACAFIEAGLPASFLPARWLSIHHQPSRASPTLRFCRQADKNKAKASLRTPKRLSLFLFVFCFLCAPSLSAESDQQKVKLRGYLHRSAQDEWYLTPQPDTPSCCVASANKSHEQIFLSNFTVEEVSNKPITVEGILKISPNHPKFTLLEATKIEDNKKHFPWIAISFVALSIGVFLIGKKVIDR